MIVTAACALTASPALGAPEVSLQVKTTKQAKLISSGKVKVEASAEDAHKAKLSVSVVQAGDRTKIAKATKASLAERPKTFTLKLNADGNRLVQSCISTKLEAKAGGDKATAKM